MKITIDVEPEDIQVALKTLVHEAPELIGTIFSTFLGRIK